MLSKPPKTPIQSNIPVAELVFQQFCPKLYPQFKNLAVSPVLPVLPSICVEAVSLTEAAHCKPTAYLQLLFSVKRILLQINSFMSSVNGLLFPL